MMGWFVFGTLGAILAAELYVIFKQEEKANEEEVNKDECKCSCCHCHKEEENKDEE